MIGCLKIFRWFSGISLGFLFLFLIFVGSFLMTIGSLVTNRANTKSFIAQSGIYENGINIAADTAYDQATKSDNTGNSQPSSRNQPDLQKFISKDEFKTSLNKIISKDFIEKNVTMVVDATYDWLDGKTLKPTFTIDISQIKTQATQVITEFIEKKVDILPLCKTGKTVKNASELQYNFDVFNADCLPKGAKVTDINQIITTEAGNLNTVDTSSFSSNNIPIDQNALKTLPQMYNYLKLFPLVFVASLIIIGLTIIFTIPTKKIGIIFVASLCIFGGLMLLFAAPISTSIANNQLDQQISGIKDINPEIKGIITHNVTSFLQLVQEKNNLIAIILIILGVIAIATVLGYSFIKKKKTTKQEIKEVKVS